MERLLSNLRALHWLRVASEAIKGLDVENIRHTVQTRVGYVASQVKVLDTCEERMAFLKL